VKATDEPLVTLAVGVGVAKVDVCPADSDVELAFKGAKVKVSDPLLTMMVLVIGVFLLYPRQSIWLGPCGVGERDSYTPSHSAFNPRAISCDKC
jgi:hypothetical protein